MRRRARNIIGGGWRGQALWGLMMVLMIVGSVSTAAVAHAGPSNGSMQIVVPAPAANDSTVQGPPHTHLSLSATQATAGASYQLGWAAQSDGCASPTGFHSFANDPVAASDGGAFTATIVWPTVASDPNTTYLICAVDTANPTTDIITADQTFQVLGSSIPQIALAQAPTAPNKPKGYFAGGLVEVRGSGFLPQGTAVAVFLTSSATFLAQDYQPSNALATVDGSQISSDASGNFTADVTLPTAYTGQLYLHAVSTDGAPTNQPPFPPSLVANHVIQIGGQLPTPTVKPSPSPTPKANGNTHKSDSPPPHMRRIIAIVLLGIVSLILFVVGGILVASATLGARSPSALANGGQNVPDSVHSGPGW